MSTEFRDPHGAHRNVGIPVSGVRWSGYESRGEDLRGMIFQECTFEDVSFIGCQLEKTIFIQCTLDGVTVEDCALDLTQWVQCTGRRIRIGSSDKTLLQPVFAGSKLTELIVGARCDRLIVSDCALESIAFEGAGLEQYGLTISGGAIERVQAAQVRWQMGSILKAKLAGWDLSGAVLTQCALVEASGEEVDLVETTFERCNLHGSQLPGVQLRRIEGSIFSACDMTGADLKGSTANQTLMVQSDLRQVRLAGAELGGAILSESDLRGADVTGAQAPRSVWMKSDLRDAVLDRLHAPWSSFAHARFAGATVEGARLENCDLHGVTDLPPGALTAGARGTIEWRAERERGSGLVPGAA